MITKQVESEFGSYTIKLNHGYQVCTGHFCIDAFVDVPEDQHWEKCPCCGCTPKIWEFNNGRQTACGCWEDKYNHFSVHAESIMSVHTRCDGNLSEYNSDQLRLHWNEYCATMINTCNHADLRFEGKW